ncbi:MAG TPA: 4-alpha-glucanotransferase [Candidatus Binatia bacterium]|jgi:4-alpha-glucanotransferase|nr:4-alpha-glucanotransferase [Candidatus Binatia bacterium]
MILTFQLRFHTNFGQSLWLTRTNESATRRDSATLIPLQYVNDQMWQTTMVFPKLAVPDTDIVYNYILREADGTVTQDWGNDRVVNPASFTENEVLIIDSWNPPGAYENAFYTEPFKGVLLKSNHTEVRAAAPEKPTHILKVKAPLLEKGQTLCLLGSTSALGDWNPAQPILLNRTAGKDFLTAHVDLSKETFPIFYKYGVYDTARNALLRYEDGSNRMLYDTLGPSRLTIVNDGFATLAATTWKGAGVSIPVFSLRSESSFGVGEFTDLKLLADWCRRTGLKLIQILPVNDTIATHTWADSYPYSAISAFALHPLYLNPSRVVEGESRRLLEELEPERKRLNALENLDYVALVKIKLDFLKRIYPLQKEKAFKSHDYQRFFEENAHWLVPHAVFCHLRDKYGTSDFNQWPAHRRCKAEDLAALAAKNSPAYDEIAFNYFVQYHLHLQLAEATRYAHTQGVILKGDIPIGVYRYGADAWQRPELYNMEEQAGAPPDAFAVKGQNWSFPTYNWPRMKQDGFAWWKRRFEQMGHYFDAFRIDHILGFFRIWSIPMHAVEGILGYFVPALPVYANEFGLRGIWFDRNRYVRPYITERVLAEKFGPEAEAVKERFLVQQEPGQYGLKPEFGTQRQVERHFASLEDNEQNQRLKEGLYDLISNVILFEVEGSQGQQFHFRFAIESTSSFQNLDARTQALLKDLYIDYFFRRQDTFWMKEAMQKLPTLKRVTNMLVCGEDLGLVPACVPEAMKQLGLLGLEVQRMPKNLNQDFSRPKDAPYLSVVTPSTHDMSTIRGWWKEDKKLTQRFYNQELGEMDAAPEECEPWINETIVSQHLASPAMWSIFQLQDLLGMDGQLRRKNPDEERINVPANPKHYWRYRMHLSLEKLLQAEEFNGMVRERVKQAGRGSWHPE